jgi:hypothetical protein
MVLFLLKFQEKNHQLFYSSRWKHFCLDTLQQFCGGKLSLKGVNALFKKKTYLENRSAIDTEKVVLVGLF